MSDIGPEPDENDEIKNTEFKYTENYKIHTLTNKIRDVCKKITSASRCATNFDACKDLYVKLINAYDYFYSEIAKTSQDGQGVPGIPRLSQRDLKCKTLKELSNPTFKGRKIEPMKRRTAGAKTAKKRKFFSDPEAQAELEHFVAQAVAADRCPQVEPNLWAGGLADMDLMAAIQCE